MKFILQSVSQVYVVNENPRGKKSHSVIVRRYLAPGSLSTPCARVADLYHYSGKQISYVVVSTCVEPHHLKKTKFMVWGNAAIRTNND